MLRLKCIDGAYNVFAFVTVVLAILLTFGTVDDVLRELAKKEKTKPVPMWMMVINDVALMITLAWFGKFFIAACDSLHAVHQKAGKQSS